MSMQPNNISPSLSLRIWSSLGWELALFVFTAVHQVRIVLSEAHQNREGPTMDPRVKGLIEVYGATWIAVLPIISIGSAIVLRNKFRAPGWRSPMSNLLGRGILVSVFVILSIVTVAAMD
jgi:hypothetical protein